MVNETSSNVKLSLEQLQQIEAAKQRLTNIEAEVAITKDTLANINKEILTVAKDRKYQEELLASLTADASAKQEQLDTLTSQIAAARETLSEVVGERDGLLKDNADRSAQLDKREAAIATKEQEVSDRLTAVSAEESLQKASRAQIDAAYEAFTTALKAVSWK